MACSTQTALVVEDSCSRLMDSCREFCLRRQRDAEEYKNELANKPLNVKANSFMDLALEKLRKDMATVVEQDIHLLHLMMKMGDSIETLKHQHLFEFDYDSSDDETDEDDYEDYDLEDIVVSSTSTDDSCSAEESECSSDSIPVFWHHVQLSSKDDDAENSADDSGYYGDSSEDDCSDLESDF